MDQPLFAQKPFPVGNARYRAGDPVDPGQFGSAETIEVFKELGLIGEADPNARPEDTQQQTEHHD